MSTTPTTILDNLDTVAVLAGGIFAGAALYVTIGEVPALRAFGLDEHWRFFPYMYKRAAASQSVLAAVAGVAGIIHGTRIIGAPFYRNLWIVSGSVFLGAFPYTLICLLPTNKRIINDNESVKLGNTSQFNDGKRKELLDKWAVLHFVRTAGSVISFGAMIFGLSRHTSLVYGW